MTSIFVTWLVTSISLFIISKLPLLGVSIDGFGKAILSAAVIGILNALVLPVLAFFAMPLTFITFGLFAIILNAIIFGLAARLVQGFTLRGGIWSAIFGAVALTFMNTLIYGLFR